MFQRQRRNQQSGPDTRRPDKSDPWRASGEARGSDQSIWVLSYLDVMMILFAFFVLLFAYQRSLTPSAATVEKFVTVQASPRTESAPGTPTPRVSEPAPRPSPPKADSVAVAAMKAQAPLYRISREAAHGNTAHAAPPTAERDAVAGAARLAWAQTGQWISDTLRQETEDKQVEVWSNAKQVRLELSETILFEPASADLSLGGGDFLDKVLPILARQPGVVYVEGHTDNTPIANARYPSNWELSTARATAVTRYLIGRGVASERLRAVGLADTQPRADNDSVTGRARNRRVSLVLSVDQSGS